MARQKQKWTVEEEQALCAGVEKHGHGKWKAILSDPQFASLLVNRTNVDLKDKWRNLSGSCTASSSREMVRTPILEGVTTILPLSTLQPLSAVPLLEYGGTAEPFRNSVARTTDSDSDSDSDSFYKATIFDTLKFLKDENGSDVNAIINSMEETYELPENYRRCVTSMLSRLVESEELVKVNDCYKRNIIGPRYNVNQLNASKSSATPIPRETSEDAALVAAYMVADAENEEREVIEICDEAHISVEFLEESEAMLKLIEELHEQCLRDGQVVFKLK